MFRKRSYFILFTIASKASDVSSDAIKKSEIKKGCDIIIETLNQINNSVH